MMTLSKMISMISGEIGTSADARAYMRYFDPHIATADKRVIKDFFKCCRENPRNMCRAKRIHRLNAYRDLILIHRKNQALYDSVMGGI